MIKQATFDTPGFKEYHQRMQLFILLYIEGGSYIDEDPAWEFVCLFVNVPLHHHLHILTYIFAGTKNGVGHRVKTHGRITSSGTPLSIPSLLLILILSLHNILQLMINNFKKIYLIFLNTTYVYVSDVLETPIALQTPTNAQH